MIDVESLWTSESAVENLLAVQAEFYNVMCNAPVPHIDEIRKMDAKRDFAFVCKCGNRHAAHGSVWAVVARTINTSTPSEDHPEHEEYKRLRKEFMQEVKHIDVRDYAEPFLKETEEGEYIEEALKEQQRLLTRFLNKICSSDLNPETQPDSQVVVGYECKEHETVHYITAEQNNSLRSNVNGAHVNEKYLPFLCKLSQRIVLRDTSAAFRDFNEAHPPNKVESIAYLKRAEKRKLEKEQRRLVAEAQQARAAARKARHEEAKAALQERNAKKEKNREAQTALAKTKHADQNLYILKPSLMSKEWLVEYHVCGRKVSYSKVSDALVFKHTQAPPGYDVYECPYCSGWHIGRQGKESPTENELAKRGLFWYRRNAKKANAFIHKIMMEEF